MQNTLTSRPSKALTPPNPWLLIHHKLQALGSKTDGLLTTQVAGAQVTGALRSEIETTLRGLLAHSIGFSQIPEQGDGATVMTQSGEEAVLPDFIRLLQHFHSCIRLLQTDPEEQAALCHQIDLLHSFCRVRSRHIQITQTPKEQATLH